MSAVALVAALLLLPPDEQARSDKTDGYHEVEMEEGVGGEEEEATSLMAEAAKSNMRPGSGRTAGAAANPAGGADAAPAQLTWCTIFASRSTSSACMAYVYTARECSALMHFAPRQAAAAQDSKRCVGRSDLHHLR